MSFLNMFFKILYDGLAEMANINVGIGVVKGSPEFPRHKVQLDLSNGNVSRFKKTLGP
jgi:hypothetical protein